MTPAPAIPLLSMTWPQYRRHECVHRGWRVRLMPREAELLLLLMLRRGETVTNDEAIAFVWPDTAPADGIAALRAIAFRLGTKLPGAIAARLGFGRMIAREHSQ
jgi:hypothetical protein